MSSYYECSSGSENADSERGGWDTLIHSLNMRILIFCYILIIGSPVFAAYSLITKTVEGHKVRIFHVPKNDDYVVSVAARNEATSLKNLISESDAVAGINGAYFTPKDYTGKPDSTNTIRVV